MEIDRLMPPLSRFGGSGRAAKKQGIIDKLTAFFEKYSGLGIADFHTEEQALSYDEAPSATVLMAAEDSDDER